MWTGSPRNATWCAVGSQDHRLLKEIVAKSPWPEPVRVYGYNHETAASLFEAETNCLPNLAALISGNKENDGLYVSAFRCKKDQFTKTGSTSILSLGTLKVNAIISSIKNEFMQEARRTSLSGCRSSRCSAVSK